MAAATAPATMTWLLLALVAGCGGTSSRALDMPWARTDDPARDRSPDTRAILDALELRSGHRVADVGAGAGYFSVKIARAVGPSGAVVATDVDERMVTHLRREAERRGLSRLEARRVGADHLELEPGSVDRILMVDSLVFPVCEADRGRALLVEAARALRSGGRLVIYRGVVHDERWSPPYGAPPPCRESGPDDLARLGAGRLRLTAQAAARTRPPDEPGAQRGYLVVLERAPGTSD